MKCSLKNSEVDYVQLMNISFNSTVHSLHMKNTQCFKGN